MSCVEEVDSRVRKIFREVCNEHFGKSPTWSKSPKDDYGLTRQSTWESAEAEILERLIALDECHEILRGKYGPETPGTWKIAQTKIRGHMFIESYKNCC